MSECQHQLQQDYKGFKDGRIGHCIKCGRVFSYIVRPSKNIVLSYEIILVPIDD